MHDRDDRDLRDELKRLLIEDLNLKGRDPASLADDAPLFGEGGLGLDSLDALQIAMSVEERWGVRLPDGDDARPVFRSVASLAAYVGPRASAARPPKSA